MFFNLLEGIYYLLCMLYTRRNSIVGAILDCNMTFFLQLYSLCVCVCVCYMHLCILYAPICTINMTKGIHHTAHATRSLTDLELGLQPSGSIDPPACTSLNPWNYRHTHPPPAFDWAWELKSGSHACLASPIPTKPYSQTTNWSLLIVYLPAQYIASAQTPRVANNWMKQAP